MSQNILECGPDEDIESLVDIITEILTATPASEDPRTISLTADKSDPNSMACLVALIYNRLSDIECSLNVSYLTSCLCIRRGCATVKFPVNWLAEHLQKFRDILHFYTSLMHVDMSIQDLEHLVTLALDCLPSSGGLNVTNVNILFQQLAQILSSNKSSPDSSNESKETKPLEKNKNQPSE